MTVYFKCIVMLLLHREVGTGTGREHIQQPYTLLMDKSLWCMTGTPPWPALVFKFWKIQNLSLQQTIGGRQKATNEKCAEGSAPTELAVPGGAGLNQPARVSGSYLWKINEFDTVLQPNQTFFHKVLLRCHMESCSKGNKPKKRSHLCRNPKALKW